MFKISLHFIFLYLLFTTINTAAQFGTMPPFKLELSPLNTSKLPGLHSFSFALSGSKWLFIGGRINGLHGNSSNDGFEAPFVNNDIVVIDTASWKAYSVSLNQLPLSVADPLRSTNMEYYREGDYLYMLGGYGYDSTQYDFVTFPVLSAIHVNNMIDAVINGKSIAPHIRQLKDTIPMICGGDLNKLGDYYYLTMGQVFGGRYSDPPSPLFFQYYSNKIKRFKIIDDGIDLKFSNFSYWKDTVNFHRRDLNVLPIVRPNGSFAHSAYGGVFQKKFNLPYQEPITIDESGAVVHYAYKQLMSQYTCATIPVFDSVSRDMYTTFLGGISLYDYDEVNNKLNCDSLIPFINDITTFTRHADGKMEETILPVHLRGLLGSNALFIPNLSIAHYDNGVIKLRELPKTKTFIGYLFGGIKASKPNKGPSTSNDTVYRIYLTPDFNAGIKEQVFVQQFKAYPNPTINATVISFNLKEPTVVTLQVVDVTGRIVTKLIHQKLGAGSQEVNWDTSTVKPGLYFALLTCNEYTGSIKVCIQ